LPDPLGIGHIQGLADVGERGGQHAVVGGHQGLAPEGQRL
jgi:hypothetical protein